MVNEKLLRSGPQNVGPSLPVTTGRATW